MYHYIGIDVSKLTLQVFIAKNNSTIEIDNNKKSLRVLYKKLLKLYKDDSFVFIYEPTANYSKTLMLFCAENNIMIYVVNPYISSSFSKSTGNRSKTDISDAQMLYNMHLVIKEKNISVPVIDKSVEQLKEIMSYYKFLQKQKVAFKNHLEAAKANHGSKQIISQVNKNIVKLQAEQNKLIEKAKIMVCCNRDLKEHFDNISSIKGVGDLIALILLYLFLKYPNANRSQITALLGLDPIIVESGTSIKRRSRISKRGTKFYRGMIFYSILSTIRFNDEFKDYYDKMKKRNCHSTVAQVAIMRKLALLAHSLYKNKCHYNPKLYLDKKDENNIKKVA
ncbi:IS110 family transposase [Sulfurimonas sp.]|uniref:IS110 family transposase n=1 Tax=Sulfurimonas sp. TaxID=2022749 RepID=UPI00261065B9|nr:IS110 family transposase [Sulfurimonas sp.]